MNTNMTPCSTDVKTQSLVRVADPRMGAERGLPLRRGLDEQTDLERLIEEIDERQNVREMNSYAYDPLRYGR